MISESEVERLFIARVRGYLDEPNRRNELHLTDLCSPCFRRVWFDKKDPWPRDTEAILRLWRGKALHELPLLEMHELELEYDGVKTRIDEYSPEFKILIEKKTADFIPRDIAELKRYYQHYLDQVAFEWLLLVKNGHDCRQIFLLFIKDGQQTESGRKPLKAFDVTELIDFDNVETMFIERKTLLAALLERGQPPDVPENFTAFDYPCSYCEYRGRCW